jgi:hypothetical protein
MITAEEVAPGFDHKGSKADLTHIDIRYPGIEALFIQLSATLPDPGSGLTQLLA